MSGFLGRVIETTAVHLTAGVAAKAVERGADVVRERWFTPKTKQTTSRKEIFEEAVEVKSPDKRL